MTLNEPVLLWELLALGAVLGKVLPWYIRRVVQHSQEQQQQQTKKAVELTRQQLALARLAHGQATQAGPEVSSGG